MVTRDDIYQNAKRMIGRQTFVKDKKDPVLRAAIMEQVELVQVWDKNISNVIFMAAEPPSKGEGA